MAHPDLVLLRREWNEKDKRFFTEIRVEDVRRAIHMFQQAAGRGGYRICILDCAEDLNAHSANALLKIIEEPPPRSLFLLVAHRPGQMLATLRSRCQKIVLKPLAAPNIGHIVAALGPPWSAAGEAKLEASIARAQGSIQNVLRLLDDRGIELDTNLGRMLDNLPRIDWSRVHALADRVTARNNGKDYETMLAAIDAWLDTRVRAARGASRRLCTAACALRPCMGKTGGDGARDRNLQSGQEAVCPVPVRRFGCGGAGFFTLKRDAGGAVIRGFRAKL